MVVNQMLATAPITPNANASASTDNPNALFKDMLQQRIVASIANDLKSKTAQSENVASLLELFAPQHINDLTQNMGELDLATDGIDAALEGLTKLDMETLGKIIPVDEFRGGENKALTDNSLQVMIEESKTKLEQVPAVEENTEDITNLNDTDVNLSAENGLFQSVQNTEFSATVAKSENSNPLYAQTVSTVDDLGENILPKIEAGVKEFEIALEPDYLGKIVIKATETDGKTMISIECTNSNALKILGANAPEIANLIETRLGNETQVVVETPPKDYLQQQANPESKQGQQGQNQNEQNQKHAESDSFLQQLRLGLT